RLELAEADSLPCCRRRRKILVRRLAPRLAGRSSVRSDQNLAQGGARVGWRWGQDRRRLWTHEARLERARPQEARAAPEARAGTAGAGKAGEHGPSRT